MDIKDDGDSSMGFKTEKDVDAFLTFLSQSKAKYAEWSKTAIENDVTDVTKEITTAQVGNSIAFHYGSWHFSFGKHGVTSYFLMFKGKPYMSVMFPKVQASDNQYIDQESVQVIFNNTDQIDALAAALSRETIDAFITDINKKKDLFN